MVLENVKISVGEATVTGRLVTGGNRSRPGRSQGVLLAHGAGTDQDHDEVSLLKSSRREATIFASRADPNRCPG